MNKKIVPILAAPWTKNLVQPEPLEQMPPFLALLLSSCCSRVFQEGKRNRWSHFSTDMHLYGHIGCRYIEKSSIASLHAPLLSHCSP